MTVRAFEQMGRPASLILNLRDALQSLEEDPPSMIVVAGSLAFRVLTSMGGKPHLERVVRICLIDDPEDTAKCYMAGADLALLRPLEDEQWKEIVGLTT